MSKIKIMNFTVLLLILMFYLSCQQLKEKDTGPSYPEKIVECDGIWSWSAGGETLAIFSINNSFSWNDTVAGANGFTGTIDGMIMARNVTLNQIKVNITSATGDFAGGEGHDIYITYDLADANTWWYDINYAGVYPASGHVYGPFARTY